MEFGGGGSLHKLRTEKLKIILKKAANFANGNAWVSTGRNSNLPVCFS